jgi:hypothetical protein
MMNELAIPSQPITLEVYVSETKKQYYSQVATKADELTITNFADADQIATVKEKAKELQKLRTSAENDADTLKEGLNKARQNIFDARDSLLELVVPAENRLKGMLEDAKKYELIELRKKILPTRHEALAKIGDGVEATDAELLEMDDAQFTGYRIARIDAKQEADRIKLEAEQRKIDAENARIAREKELEDAKKQASIDAQAKAEQDARDAIEKANKVAQDAIDALAREKEDKARADEAAARETARLAKEAEDARVALEKKEAAEKKRLEKMKKYRTFRTEHGWTEETKEDYKEENTGTTIELWKRVGTFEL